MRTLMVLIAACFVLGACDSGKPPAKAEDKKTTEQKK